MSFSKTRARSAGFTLVEVLVALAIIALVSVVLLGQRVEIVREAGRTRDMRTAWALAAQKMGELELDTTLFQGEGGGSSGDFHEYGEDYGLFLYEWEVRKEEVPTNDPNNPQEQPRVLFRMKLTVKVPSAAPDESPIVIESFHPMPKEEKK